MRCLLGALLLTTAILKMSGGSNAITRTALPFVSPRLYATGVVFEAILGVWLLAGIARQWSWFISIGFFGLLTYMSFRLGWLGQKSCGCAGSLRFSPWWAFSIDIIAIVALSRWRPAQIVAGIRNGLPTLFGGAVVTAGLAIALCCYYGSYAGAMAHLHGETVVVDSGVVKLGDGKKNGFGKAEVRLKNYGDQTIRIVGGTSDCSCMSTDDLPIEIPPGESSTIGVRVKFTGSVGQFARRFVLYADDEKLKIMPVTVTGRVMD